MYLALKVHLSLRIQALLRGSRVCSGMRVFEAQEDVRRPLIHDFASVRNIADGAVFIIASGCSANEFPIERFPNVPMITMNGAITKFIGTGIKPYFYVCSDVRFAAEQPAMFNSALLLSQRVALWPEQIGSLPVAPIGPFFALGKASKASPLRVLFKPDPALVRNWAPWSRRSRSLGFSKDLSRGFFDARTVAYVALQIAYHLGFTKVILVGMDLNQAAGRFYETQGPVSPCWLDEYYERRILPSLQLMADRVVGQRFAVYNLSACSRIPESVIPKVSLAQVEALVGCAVK